MNQCEAQIVAEMPLHTKRSAPCLASIAEIVFQIRRKEQSGLCREIFQDLSEFFSSMKGGWPGEAPQGLS